MNETWNNLIIVVAQNHYVFFWYVIVSVVGSLYAITKSPVKFVFAKRLMDFLAGVLIGILGSSLSFEYHASIAVSITCAFVCSIIGAQLIDLIFSLLPTVFIQAVRALIKNKFGINITITKKDLDKK